MTSQKRMTFGPRHLAVLALYVATAVGLVYAMVVALPGASDRGHIAPVIVVTVFGVVAVVAMFVDMRDRWLRGGTLQSWRLAAVRGTAIVAFLAAMGVGLLSEYFLASIILLPGVVIYFSVVSPPRKPGQEQGKTQSTPQAGGRTRQRRGGRKRR